MSTCPQPSLVYIIGTQKNNDFIFFLKDPFGIRTQSTYIYIYLHISIHIFIEASIMHIHVRIIWSYYIDGTTSNILCSNRSPFIPFLLLHFFLMRLQKLQQRRLEDKGFEDLPIKQWKGKPWLLRVLIGDYTIQFGGVYFINHDIRIPSWNNQDSMERIRRGFFVAQLGWCWFFWLVYKIPMDAYEVKAIQIENSAHMLSFYDLSDVGSFPLSKWIRLKIDVPLRSGCMLELTSSRFSGSRISSTYTRLPLRCSSCVHNERMIIVEDIQGFVKTTGFCISCQFRSYDKFPSRLVGGPWGTHGKKPILSNPYVRCINQVLYYLYIHIKI